MVYPATSWLAKQDGLELIAGAIKTVLFRTLQDPPGYHFTAFKPAPRERKASHYTVAIRLSRTAGSLSISVQEDSEHNGEMTALLAKLLPINSTKMLNGAEYTGATFTVSYREFESFLIRHPAVREEISAKTDMIYDTEEATFKAVFSYLKIILEGEGFEFPENVTSRAGLVAR